ncbi:MAG: metallophosphoesterase [Nocardioidaceae bacterium]
MRFAVGDVHGFHDALVASMQHAGLVDEHRDWSGGEARVCFLGDFFDRGPDGVGAVESVMRWQKQAAEAGGEIAAVLGNHELLALGVHKFGASMINTDRDQRSFALAWMTNGGQVSDQDRLRADHVDWLTGLPAILRWDSDILMHADTCDYLEIGDTIDAINDQLAEALGSEDAAVWWAAFRRLTSRYAFLEDSGVDRARQLLDRLGGRRIVHGHSTIGDLTDSSAVEVRGPWAYADGLVLAVDGGMYEGGPLLVVPLETSPA